MPHLPVKLDENPRHHSREMEFHQRLIVHSLNQMRSNEEPFLSIILVRVI
jgi:hypothetical protein